MAKRLGVVFLIVLGAAIFVFAGFLLVLFLAPGFQAFGLKFIAQNTHVVSKEALIIDEVEDSTFSGSIKIEANEIPIEIVFTGDNLYAVKYYDNYSGLTTSKFEDPSITITKDTDGAALIKVETYKSFVYESSSSKRKLTVNIPMMVVGGSSVGVNDLTILSDTSEITFTDVTKGTRVATFNKLKVETSGKLIYNTPVYANTFDYKTMNMINISDDEKTSVIATNYILNSTSSRITVTRDVSGDITATTNNAGISILSCKNFIADSGYGDIFCSNPEGDIIVNGYAKVNTKAGNIAIGKILSETEKSEIHSGSGKVTIKKIVYGDITTTLGAVRINSAGRLKVETNVGKVVVEEATTSIDVSTKRGSIYLGSESATISNPTVYTRLGKIFVYSASGTVDLQSLSNSVLLENTNSSNIKIDAGAGVTANNLTGKVDIKANADSVVSFKDFTDTSKIDMGESNSKLRVNILSNTIEQVRFVFSGKLVTRWEYSEELQQSSNMSSSTNMASEEPNLSNPLLTISGANATIDVYFKASTI